jgi:hypothetical protein
MDGNIRPAALGLLPDALSSLRPCLPNGLVVCNVVQHFPDNRTLIGIERPARKKAGPVLPRSAAIGFLFGASLNLRVVGSIPTRLTT